MIRLARFGNASIRPAFVLTFGQQDAGREREGCQESGENDARFHLDG